MNILLDLTGPADAAIGPALYPRRGIHGTIVHAIGSDIVNGELRQGEKLPGDQEMMARFHASRTAWREAMKVLASKGLIKSRQRAGTYVQPRRDWDLLDVDVLSWHRPENISEAFTADLIELRELIEPVAAKMAADRANSDDLTRIEAAYLRMQSAVEDYEGFYAADLDFHLGVLHASHNQLVQRLSGIIGTVLGLSFSLQKQIRPQLRSSAAAHYKVFENIRQRNRRGAERAMRIIIRQGSETLGQQRKAMRDQSLQAP